MTEGSITIVRPLKLLFLTFYQLKIDNFRFKPEVLWRIWKLMISLNSACLITPISTLKLLLVCLNPLKPITSGREVSKHPLLFLKPTKIGFFLWLTGNFRSLPVIGHGRDPAHDTSQPFGHDLQPDFRSLFISSFSPIAAMSEAYLKKPDISNYP